jgi:lysophospholipase L1-like esterase
VNPNCHFIFTISPVRHLKDGFVENQRSKAHLITAIHEIIDRQHTTIDYFPSYEIMIDELRDYRFYANDFLHPSSLATDYIWERFFQSQIDENDQAIMQEVGAIQKALLHKPFHPNSENHQKFVKNLNHKIAALIAQYPQIKF